MSKKKPKSRPSKPAEQKRRRGSALQLGTVHIGDTSNIVEALKKAAPLMRQRFVEAMNGELAVIGMDMAQGRDRTAYIEVRVGRDKRTYEVKEVTRGRAKSVRR